MRATIGAALQEAALDPFLTGREHLRLQAASTASKVERRERGDELLSRVGLTRAADRKVQTYSGGMKRRLDLALALVHGPSHPVPRRADNGPRPAEPGALWGEVGRLAREEGVTVFLTTQYLEEADVLADRVGIIDHGRLVAEGTPAELKAEIGRSTVEVAPADPERAGEPAATSGALRRGDGSAARATIAVRLDGDGDLADIVRTLDAEDLKVEDQPPRAVARRRLPREDRPVARGRAEDDRRDR